MSSKWRRFEVLLPLQFNDAPSVEATYPPNCLAQPLAPITRSSMLMHHGSDEDSIKLYFVKNRERKAGYQSFADVCAVDWACFRELLDATGCISHGCQEIRTETFGPCFIRTGRLYGFFGSFRMEDCFHRLRASRALRKTSSAGMP